MIEGRPGEQPARLLVWAVWLESPQEVSQLPLRESEVIMAAKKTAKKKTAKKTAKKRATKKVRSSCGCG